MFGFYDTYFKLFGLTITYYGLIIACAMAIGLIVACKNAKMRGLKANDIMVLACYVIPLAIIGARLYYVLFSLDKYTTFWSVFRIWDGGLAVYGGVIGGAIAIMLYCLIKKKNFLDIADIVVPGLILGQAIGRIGCYFGDCCYGNPTTDPNLMVFPLSVLRSDGVWYLATMFYESLWDFLGFAILIALLRYFKVKQRGAITASYFIIYGVGRALLEILRSEEQTLYIGSFKVSQLLSIILVAVGVALLLAYFIMGEIKKGRLKNLLSKGQVDFMLKHDNLYQKLQKTQKNAQISFKTVVFVNKRAKIEKIKTGD